MLTLSPRAHFYIAASLLTAAFTPFGMSILDEKQLTSADKLANYRESTAQITRATEVRTKSGTNIHITYEFQANAGEIYGGSGTLSPSEWRDKPKGQPIRVYFDPSAPAKNTLARSVDDFAGERPLALRLSVAVLIAAPLAAILAAFWTWAVSRRRAGKKNTPFR